MKCFSLTSGDSNCESCAQNIEILYGLVAARQDSYSLAITLNGLIHHAKKGQEADATIAALKAEIAELQQANDTQYRTIVEQDKQIAETQERNAWQADWLRYLKRRADNQSNTIDDLRNKLISYAELKDALENYDAILKRIKASESGSTS